MDWIQPMEPISTKKLIDGEDFIHQIKWDGIRGLAYIVNRELKVFTKKGHERTGFYPELNALVDLTDADSVVLDGEIIVPDDKGRPSFHRVLARERVKSLSRVTYYSRTHPVFYMAFDIMSINGRDITSLSFLERREWLCKVLKPGQCIGITDNYTDGHGLFNLMKEKGWEGIVSKQVNSRYLPGKSHNSWYKLKIAKKLLAAVCGITWKDNCPNSLILGLYRDNELIYIGKASTGLTQDDFYELKNNVRELESDRCPFDGIPLHKGERVTWFKPVLTCWIKFLEWTDDGVLRHPVILGFNSGNAYEANGQEMWLDD